MITIQSSCHEPIDSFSNVVRLIGDKYTSTKGFAYTNVRENYGKGNISVTVFSKDISVLIFDVILNQETGVELLGNSKKTMDFIFCLEGSVNHRFRTQSQLTPILFRQNSIVNRSENSESIVILPANTPIKMSLITYSPPNDYSTEEAFDRLRLNLDNVLSDVYKDEDRLYLGRICFRTSNFVNEIINRNTESPADILFKEAAILNTLASQIDRHIKDMSNEHQDAPLKLYEIDKILALETFIEDNLTEKLTLKRLESISGLSASKLQLGFKYLFDKTVSTYITEKRLQKAASLIYEAELNVSELVYSVGFTSRSYFSKIFKNYYGILPSKCVSNPEMIRAKLQ